MQVHTAFVAKRRKPRMHLGGHRTGMRAVSRMFGPKPLFRETLSDIFDDRKRIPDGDVTIDQYRHFARTRDVENALLVGRARVERNENLLERNVAGTQRKPRPHRPRRIVLVADHKLQGHFKSVLDCLSGSAPVARHAFKANLKSRPVAAIKPVDWI